jgi:hypothetical protein
MQCYICGLAITACMGYNSRLQVFFCCINARISVWTWEIVIMTLGLNHCTKHIKLIHNNKAVSVCMFHFVKIYQKLVGWWWIMNWKRCGKRGHGLICGTIQVFSWKNWGKLRKATGESASGLRFKPRASWTSWIWNITATHSPVCHIWNVIRHAISNFHLQQNFKYFNETFVTNSLSYFFLRAGTSI